METMETEPTTVSQVLQRGRQRVKTGWCQYTLLKTPHGGGQEFCAVGAVSLRHDRSHPLAWSSLAWPSRLGKDLIDQALYALDRALPRHGPCPNDYLNACGAVVEYNNAPGRTQADILALFDKALTEVVK